MCDRLNEKDERFGRGMEKVSGDGCGAENERLSKCLRENGNRFGMCREEVSGLKVCVEKGKLKVDGGN